MYITKNKYYLVIKYTNKHLNKGTYSAFIF